MLDDLTTTIRSVATTAAPSVVRVQAGRHWRTVGVIIDTDRVLTNAHGVPPEGEVQVRFTDGEVAAATVSARDHDGDLAVLEVGTGERATLPWAPAAPGVGDVVVTVVPTRHGTRTTHGMVSATGRRFRGPGGRPIDDGVEHTALLARGSSGSPILDVEGRLLGLNTHRTEPFYLALPVGTRLQDRAERLGSGEAPTRRHLGIAVAPPRVAARLRSAVGLDPRDGVLVREVDDDGPAAHAGIERGDLLVAAGSAPLVTPDDLFVVLADAADELVLTVARGDVEREVTVAFG